MGIFTVNLVKTCVILKLKVHTLTQYQSKNQIFCLNGARGARSPTLIFSVRSLFFTEEMSVNGLILKYKVKNYTSSCVLTASTY